MAAWLTPWALLAVPCAGALISAPAWAKLRALRTGLLLSTMAALLTALAAALVLDTLPSGLPFLCLLPLVAFASLLAQPLHRDNRGSWVLTVILLGVGQAAVTAPPPAQSFLVGLLFILILGALFRLRHPAAPVRWSLATFAFAVAAEAGAVLAPAPLDAVAGLAVCLVLVPLFPLHAAYVAALSRLPGSLPAFLIVALPAVGFSRLLTVLPALPDLAREALVWLALAGMVYGTMLALAQPRPLPLLAHAALALCSMFWWSVGITGTLASESAVFLAAVGLSLSGLYLGWYAVRARFGDLDLRALGGLVQPMPRFAMLFSLLALAALGFPPFGVFSGFMGMVLVPTSPLPVSFAVVAFAWLAVSWYVLELKRRLLFGRPRPDLRYEDLRDGELAAMTIVLVVVTALGIMPSRWFDAGAASAPSRASVETSAWNR